MFTRVDEILRKYRLIGTSILMLVAVAVYHQVLSGGFVYDDVTLVVENPYLKNPLMWRKIFEGSLFSFEGPGAQSGYYRPLTVFTYWLICRVAGFNPVAYHATLLGFYCLTVWIVYRLGRKLLNSELAAYTGALLWAIQPLHVEVVAWISSMSDIGCTLFCLLALWLFLRAEEHAPHNLGWHAAAAAVYFPALFFKEIALSLPLVLLVYWFCHPGESWLRRGVRWIPYLAAVVACSAIRLAVMGRFSQSTFLRKVNWQTPFAAVALLGQHLKITLWPVNLSEFRDFNLGASLRSPWPFLLMLMVVAALLGRKREPQISFLVLWWVAGLTPCLNYWQLTIPLVADRFSYFGSVGLCLAIGYLAFEWSPGRVKWPSYAPVAAGVVAVLAVFWTVQTVRYVPRWRDNDSFFRYSLTTSPNAAALHVLRGLDLQMRSNDYKGAAMEFRTALKLNKQDIRPLADVYYNSWIGLGQIALIDGHEAEALNYFHRAVRLLPRQSLAYSILGSVYFPRGDYAQAAEYFKQAVSANPMETEGRFYLGTCLIQLHQPLQAAEQFHAAWDVDPTFREAYQAEAHALEVAGDFSGAAAVRKKIPQE